MTTKPNGGQAFPTADGNAIEGGYTSTERGMTLRDWFAGQALAGMAGDSELTDDWEHIAIKAYYAADEMLKQRDKS